MWRWKMEVSFPVNYEYKGGGKINQQIISQWEYFCKNSGFLASYHNGILANKKIILKLFMKTKKYFTLD